MASTEERLWRKSGETVGLLASFHGADYPSSCTEQTDLGCQEDLGELPDPLEEVDVVNPHYQPASMWTDSDASAIAFRALDLMFPHEDSPDDSSDWSDWSAREDVGDIDDAQVIDRNNEKDGPGSEIVDEFSTEEGSEEDDDYNGYSKEKDKETDCPGREVVDDCSTQEGSDKDNDCNGQAEEKDKETNCPGKNYPESEAEEIQYKWLVRYSKQVGYYANLRNEFMARGDEDSPFPPYPLFVFPDATAQCIRGGGNCYHNVYKTYDTSTTESALGYRTPEQMLQFFSMCLSSFDPPYPVSVYGVFAVRDELDQRRNYIFNRSRDDAVFIEKQDSFVLPLCSPCRGMYVLNRALLEVDLWVKTEGDVSADKQILSAYAEVDICGIFDSMHYARIIGDVCNLDIEYNALADSVETVIQVYAKVDHPHHVRFTTLSTGYDGYEIVLFDDKLLGNEKKLFQYIVAVKANEKLDVLLKVDHSLFQWTFQEEHVGAVCSPDDSIFEYGHFFVRVFFAPKDFQ